MEIGKSFSFVFEDKQWIPKILVAAGILLLGILFSWLLAIPALIAAALLLGYDLEITRRVIRGDAQTMPEWDNWGVLAGDGLRVIAIYLVYALPAIVVSACLGIPIGILNDSGSDAAVAFGGLFSFVLSVFSFAWSVVVSILMPAAIGRFAESGQLSTAFRFGEVWRLVRANLSTYVITFLMSWVAGLVGGLGAIACGVGWLATLPYAYMVSFHLYGQAYRATLGLTAQPVAAETL